MTIKGKIRSPEVFTYYVTGSLEERCKNTALQAMLKKIKDGGKNAFLNNEQLKSFTKGMLYSFKSEGLLNKDDTLTSCGEEIIESGKSWKTLKGAFFSTVFHHSDDDFLLKCVPVSRENTGKKSDEELFSNISKLHFTEGLFKTDKTEFRKIDFDKNAAKQTDPLNPSVTFEFDFETRESLITVQVNSGKENYKITTNDSSVFYIVKSDIAYQWLEKLKSTDVFDIDKNETRGVFIKFADKAGFSSVSNYCEQFFGTGSFSISVEDESYHYEITDIGLAVKDEDTRDILLMEYLLQKAESEYLGYNEVGKLMNDFQDLFFEIPAIEKSSNEIYKHLQEEARNRVSKNAAPYLHLMAYADLSPDKTLLPYICDNQVYDLSGQDTCIDDIVRKLFGDERDKKSVTTMSKYTAENPWNARNMMLFAESLHNKYGITLNLITHFETSEKNAKFKTENELWQDKLRRCPFITIRDEKKIALQEIHDRYFKVVRSTENGEQSEWWVLTGELDKLDFGDRRNGKSIREDIKTDTQGKVTEMRFMKIKEEGVPHILKGMMQ